jgi:hypothetical protein
VRAEDELPEEDQFGRMKYLETCQALAVSPASQILKFLESEEVHVVHYGLGLKGTQVRGCGWGWGRIVGVLGRCPRDAGRRARVPRSTCRQSRNQIIRARSCIRG